jgi:8-oxo-dGTP diphosphatase
MPNTAADLEPVHVAVGVILDGSRRVLLTRRAADSHQGGLWEFPGGKVEPGESLPVALARELHEELGIRVRRSSPLLEVRHDYGDKQVLLDVHVVWEFEGHALGREGQPLVWVASAELAQYSFPAANAAIVEAVTALEACCAGAVAGQ